MGAVFNALQFALIGLCGVFCLVLGYRIRYDERVLSVGVFDPATVTDSRALTRTTGTNIMIVGTVTVAVAVIDGAGGGLTTLWISYSVFLVLAAIVIVLVTNRYTR